MLPNPFIGPALITYSDGEIYEVEAAVHFVKDRGRISGIGSAVSDQSVAIGMKDEMPTLSIGNRAIKILVRYADIQGNLQVITSGPVFDLL